MNARSYSNINTYQRCPKKYYYTSVLKIQPKTKALALFNGVNSHEFLKVFFLALQKGMDKVDAWSEVLDYAGVLIEEVKGITFDDEMADAVDQVNQMLNLIEQYCDDYADQWDILHVEEEFIIMLDNGEVISFTPDLVVRDRESGAVWIVDHKTTSRMPESGLPFGDTQALLYYSGVQSLYPDLAGFIFNRIRKKVPTQPRLTKTGKKRVADIARIDTTYEVLLAFLREEAPELLDDPVHRRRLAELRDQQRFFWTDTVYVNEATTNAIIDDVAATIQHMNLSMETGQYPRHLQENNSYLSCSKCPFKRLCHTQLVGWDEQTVLEESYEPRDAKNPYEGEYRGED